MDPSLDAAGDYIRHYREQGVSETHIREHFLQNGWTNEWFERALAIAGPLPAPTYPPIQATPEQNSPLATSNNAVTSTPVVQKKYRVFHALGEYWTRLRLRPKQYFGAVAIGALVMAISFAPVALLAYLIFSGSGRAATSIAIIGLLILYIVWMSLGTTFFMAITSQALAPGNTPATSMVQQVRHATHVTLRGALAVALAQVITFLPLLLLVAVTIGTLLAGPFGGGGIGLIGFLPVLLTIAFIWFVLATLRLGLVQQVAVFEPNLKIRKTLSRSSFLLRSGGFINNGQWFLLKGALLIIVLFALLSFITGGSTIHHGLGDVVNSILTMLTVIIMQGVLALLYFNRTALFEQSA